VTRASIAFDADLQDYIVRHCPPVHPELARLRAESQHMPRGRMQVAPEQGHFLGFLVRLIGARRILEIGTFTGYSSLSMALALPPDGRIVTCDASVEWTGLAQEAWNQAGVRDKVELRLGLATETLQRLEAKAGPPFDLAFIDANKEDYDAYYESCLRLVRRGGMVILDNMFRDGRVLDLSITDPSVTSIQALNTKIASDDRVDRVLLPVGDGMNLVRLR
jgi:predicted O-methyltransferase YrrM